MNAKLLFVGTLALALASSLAFAQEARQLTRAEVRAEFSRAAADGTLHHTDYDDTARGAVVVSTRPRSDVLAEMAAARRGNVLTGPLRNRSYNSDGAEALRPSTVKRNAVKTDVAGAVHDGSLRRGDYDAVPVTVSRRIARERANTLGRAPAGDRPAS